MWELWVDRRTVVLTFLPVNRLIKKYMQIQQEKQDMQKQYISAGSDTGKQNIVVL